MTSNNSLSRIPTPPFVLLADDLPEVIKSWVDTMTSFGIDCVIASSLEELNRAFDRYQDEISAIILDGCIPGHMLNTTRFILGARASGFSAPIVASSSSPKYRAMMMEAGCSHEAPKNKAAFLVADLLSKP